MAGEISRAMEIARRAYEYGGGVGDYDKGGSVVDRALDVLRSRYEDGGAPVRDEDVYGPSNIEERRARVQALSEAQQKQYPGDLIEAPQGYITPAAATGVRTTELGPVPVGPGGEELSWIRQPAVLPLYRDPTAGVRSAMPGFLDVMGNVQAAPAGIAATNLARAVMKGDRPAAGVVSAMGAQPPAYQRSLSPMGFYSRGEEAVMGLPQAKGTPEQYAAMLQRAGVKPAEMEGFSEAFAGRPSVTREDIAKHFRERMPQVEETVLGVPHRELSELWPAFDRQVNKISDKWGITNQGPIIRGEYNPDFYPKEALPDIEKLASLGKRIGELSGQGHSVQVTPTKFSQYTLPGGENYREVLLKMPTKNIVAPLNADELREFENIRSLGTNQMGPNERARYYELLGRDAEYRKGKETSGDFRSQHWNEPNVLAHLRMADRVGPQGEKILHVEEIQSDWGQAGRKVGFSDPVSKVAAKEKINQLTTKYDELGRERRLAEKEMAELPDYNDRFAQLQNRVSQIGQERDLLSDQMAELRSMLRGDAIPTAPYVTSTEGWTDLALKRALREAAEGGYDRLVWTPGVEQAKRYSLGNHVRSIDYMKEGPDSYRLGIVDKRGEGIDLPKETFTAKELEDYLGRDVAAKIVNDEGRSYRGRNHKSIENTDLFLGGKGMRGYYDRIVPKRLHDLARRHDKGAKIELMEGLLPDNIAAPGMVITPAMRESILKGQPHMASGGAITDAPGGAEVAPDGLAQRAADLVRETNVLVRHADIDAPRLATLFRLASTNSMTQEQAAKVAADVLNGDIDAWAQRFVEFPRSTRIFSRINAILGGNAHKLFGRAANSTGNMAPNTPNAPMAERSSPPTYANGGGVDEAQPVARGGSEMYAAFLKYAKQNYPAEQVARFEQGAQGEPLKLMYAMNQATKNGMISGDPAAQQRYKPELIALNTIARSFNVNPRRAFGNLPIDIQARKEVDQMINVTQNDESQGFHNALVNLRNLMGKRRG